MLGAEGTPPESSQALPAAQLYRLVACACAEVVEIAGRLALQAARGAPKARQVQVLLQCARCDLLGDVTAAVSHLEDGGAASPVSQAVTLAAALTDDPSAVTAALQASGWG